MLSFGFTTTTLICIEGFPTSSFTLNAEYVLSWMEWLKSLNERVILALALGLSLAQLIPAFRDSFAMMKLLSAIPA